MIKQKTFVFNPFDENTYVAFTDTGEASIIDPGCLTPKECSSLEDFISKEKLTPTMLLNTHAHLDHVLGNDFVHRKYGLFPMLHHDDLEMLKMLEYSATFYGISATASPIPQHYLQDGEILKLGKYEIRVILTPGHSAGEVCFYIPSEKMLFGGDVLFRESIGRTDLPTGDYNTLEKSILSKLYVLPNDVTVYSGHGIPTTIGYEKKHNPFVRDRE